MDTFVQRVGDRIFGGVMTDQKHVVNGSVRVHQKHFVSRLERLPPLLG